MTRRQRRQRQKTRTNQEATRTTATQRKPQQRRRLQSNHSSRNRHAARLLSQVVPTPKSAGIGAGLTRLGTGSNNVRSLHKGKMRPGEGGEATRVKPSLASDKRHVSSPSQTPVKGKIGRGRSRSSSPLLYGTRLLILGVGIGAIVGTILSAWDPSSRQPAGANFTATAQVQQSRADEARATSLPIGQEILSLKTQVQALVAQNPKLQAGVFFVDLDTGAYLDLEGVSTFASASTIKLPILVALFQDVDAGKIRLDETLSMQPEMIGGGSGDMQYQKPGTQFTILETATKMITISDNTATNMLIARLGGAEALNQRFRAWGLTATAINNPLPDLEGTNTTSPKELAQLMAMVNQGNLVSLRSRDRILDIMRRTVTNTLLPRGLGEGATIAHKTGDIGSLVADVGLIDMPIGKRYIAAVMVKRPHNNAAAQKLIRQISHAAYEYFSQPAANPNYPTSPTATSAPVIGTATAPATSN